MKRVVNLCDIGFRLWRRGNIETIAEEYDRIYIGSYFCDRYFLLTTEKLLNEMRNLVVKKEKKVTLVIPITSEVNLVQMKKTIATIVKKYKKIIDTIVANDLGMVEWISSNVSADIILGRLFSKTLRDPRYEETLEYMEISEEVEEIIQKYHCRGIEVEGCFKKIKKATLEKEYEIYAHSSLFYMSCMRQCFFASINKDLSKKFRVNANCALECAEHRMKNVIQENKVIQRIGKAVYFSSGEKLLEESCVDTMIEIPIEMW